MTDWIILAVYIIGFFFHARYCLSLGYQIREVYDPEHGLVKRAVWKDPYGDWKMCAFLLGWAWPLFLPVVFITQSFKADRGIGKVWVGRPPKHMRMQIEADELKRENARISRILRNEGIEC